MIFEPKPQMRRDRDNLLQVAKDVLELLRIGKPGWGVAKDILSAAIARSTLEETQRVSLHERYKRRAHAEAIEHIDGNPYNNDPANLRIVTIAKNIG